MKSKNIVCGIAVLILLIFSLYNYNNTNYNKNRGDLINNSRLSSLGNTIEIIGTTLDKVRYFTTKESSIEEFNLSNGNYILFVLSNDGCDNCIWQEIELINKNQIELKDKYEFVIIYFGNNKTNTLRYKKFLSHVDRIYLSEDLKLLELNKPNKYPYFLALKESVIIDAHFPIPLDTSFSKLFYKRLQSKVTN